MLINFLWFLVGVLIGMYLYNKYLTKQDELSMVGLKKKKDEIIKSSNDNTKDNKAKSKVVVEAHNVVRGSDNLGDFLNKSYDKAEDKRVEKLINYLVNHFVKIKENATNFSLVDDYDSCIYYDRNKQEESDYLSGKGYDIMFRHYDYLKNYFENRGIKVSWYQGNSGPVFDKSMFNFYWGPIKEENKATRVTSAEIDGKTIECKEWSEDNE